MTSTTLTGSVREALHSDKDAVLRIHDDVYGGLDYLQEYYDYFLEAPHITSYVMEENGEIIAYLASCHVNDGRTAVTRAGRVRSDKQGQHLYKKFKTEIENIQRQEGKVKRHLLVKSEIPTESFLKSYTLVASKAIHMYEFETSCMHSYQDHVQSSTLIELDTVHCKFLKRDIADYLFPEKYAIIDWVPYELMESNLPLMTGKNTVLICDVNGNLNDVTKPFDAIQTNDKTNDTDATHTETVDEINMLYVNDSQSASNNQKSNQQTTRVLAFDPKARVDVTQTALGDTQNTSCISGLLTASTIFRAHHNLDVSCNLDVFGTDLSTFRTHLAFHLKCIMDTNSVKSVNLRFFTSLCVRKEVIDDLVAEFGIKPEASERRMKMYIQQDVYEKLL